MYTAIAKEFYELLETQNATDRIAMFEYQKRGWTFHGKGIWVTPPGEILPQLTIVGSSNYGENGSLLNEVSALHDLYVFQISFCLGARSIHRDLETQLVIVTNDFELRKSLYREQRQLFDYGSVFNKTILLETDREVPLWVYGFSWLLKSFF